MSYTPHLFGVRHHGPGCARALAAALEELRPDAVLIEGPPEANDLIPLLADPACVPPVALLTYRVDRPAESAFFPFADFSPELQAVRYAAAAGVPVEFIDLPMTHQFALDEAAGQAVPDEDDSQVPEGRGAATPRLEGDAPSLRTDPLGALAEAAGYHDRELWWETQVESRRDATGLFEAIAAAMTELRSRAEAEGYAGSDPDRDRLREAHMRRAVRRAGKTAEKLAVVVGAWHVPALAEMPTAKEDDALLKGLPKAKVACTLAPWTHGRLARDGGYGAGVRSPGWYAHLWADRDRAGTRWVSRAARLLRESDLDVSSAGVIEAVRLADALAAMRGHCAAGLAELNEAVGSVLCHGDAGPLAVIRERLEIGDVLGEVPEAAPTVPLARDLAAEQKRLRFKPTAAKKSVVLDLREDGPRDRSRLLHRLDVLGIPWGTLERTDGTGTFKEGWHLHWRPEFAVRLVEANVWGGTVRDAAGAKLRDDADADDDLADLVTRLDAAILADLPDAVAHLVGRVRDVAAVGADAARLAEAVPPLARVARYGDVRGTTGGDLLPVLRGLLARVFVGLPGACRSLDADAARVALDRGLGVHAALGTLEFEEESAAWREVLAKLAGDDAVHGLLRGWSTRTLLEAGDLSADELAKRVSLALSRAAEPEDAAAWVEGLLTGPVRVLLYEQAVWSALDGWLRTLPEDAFTAVLPLLRRSFAPFSAAEKREMAERVREPGAADGTATAKEPADGPAVDERRAARVLPVLEMLLGRP